VNVAVWTRSESGGKKEHLSESGVYSLGNTLRCCSVCDWLPYRVLRGTKIDRPGSWITSLDDALEVDTILEPVLTVKINPYLGSTLCVVEVAMPSKWDKPIIHPVLDHCRPESIVVAVDLKKEP